MAGSMNDRTGTGARFPSSEGCCGVLCPEREVRCYFAAGHEGRHEGGTPGDLTSWPNEGKQIERAIALLDDAADRYVRQLNPLNEIRNAALILSQLLGEM